jgi:hypothetical protein
VLRVLSYSQAIVEVSMWSALWLAMRGWPTRTLYENQLQARSSIDVGPNE